MSLKTEFENLKFDVRMQDINLSSKMITPDEVKAQLANLEDSSANATKVSVDEPTEDDLESNEGLEAGSFEPGETTQSQVEQPSTADYSGNNNPGYNPYSSDNN